MRQCTRRPPKAITKFLSTEAIEAKRLRRRLERRWLETHLESDRLAYRHACRSTNKLINCSRRNHFRDQLLAATTAKDRWSVSKELLHSTKTVHHRTTDELIKLCNLFSNYFVDKISCLKRAVASNASLLTTSLFPDRMFSGIELDSLPAVTVDEVYKIVTSIKPKTSCVDYIPTSFIKSCPALFSQLVCTLANLYFSQ